MDGVVNEWVSVGASDAGVGERGRVSGGLGMRRVDAGGR